MTPDPHEETAAALAAAFGYNAPTSYALALPAVGPQVHLGVGVDESTENDDDGPRAAFAPVFRTHPADGFVPLLFATFGEADAFLSAYGATATSAATVDPVQQYPTFRFEADGSLTPLAAPAHN